MMDRPGRGQSLCLVIWLDLYLDEQDLVHADTLSCEFETDIHKMAISQVDNTIHFSHQKVKHHQSSL